MYNQNRPIWTVLEPSLMVEWHLWAVLRMIFKSNSVRIGTTGWDSKHYCPCFLIGIKEELTFVQLNEEDEKAAEEREAAAALDGELPGRPEPIFPTEVVEESTWARAPSGPGCPHPRTATSELSGRQVWSMSSSYRFCSKTSLTCLPSVSASPLPVGEIHM